MQAGESSTCVIVTIHFFDHFADVRVHHSGHNGHKVAVDWEFLGTLPHPKEKDEKKKNAEASQNNPQTIRT